MDLLGNIFSHTPVWVWVILALLIFLGVQASRPRTVRLLRILITPAVFIVWGIVSLTTKHEITGLLVGDWLVLGLIGFGIAMALVRFPALRADRQRQIVHLPGSFLPLTRNVVIFVVKYALAVGAAIAASGVAPGAADGIALADVAVSGLCVGYFIGWLSRLMAGYRNAPALEPSFSSSSTAVPGGAS